MRFLNESFRLLVPSLIISTNVLICYGQSPGGVGAENVVWIRSDQGITDNTDSAPVSIWVDQSGARTRDFTNNNNLAPPTFRNSAEHLINFNPVVDFDGHNDGLSLEDDYVFSNGSGAQNGMTWFSIVEPDAQPSGVNKNTQYIYDFGHLSQHGYGMCYGHNGNNIGFRMYTSTLSGGSFITRIFNVGVEPKILTHVIQFGSNNGGRQSIHLNSTNTPNATSNTSLLRLTANNINENFRALNNHGPFTVGRQSKNNNLASNEGRLFDGSIAEIIGFRRVLSSTEVSKVETYLAIKYGITLDQTVTTDYVTSGDQVVWSHLATGFNNDIAGIFRDDTSLLNQKVSQSINADAIVTISLDNNFSEANDSPTRTSEFTSDQSGLIWANNNGDATDFSLTDTPIGVVRWARVWHTQATNFNERVTIRFESPHIQNGVFYHLISETDGDGNFANDGRREKSGPGIIAQNNTVTFTNVNLNNKFFTLAATNSKAYMRHGKYFDNGIRRPMEFGHRN